MKESHYHGQLNTCVWWIIPILLGVSKNVIIDTEGKFDVAVATVYAIHITPWFDIGFNGRAPKPTYGAK